MLQIFAIIKGTSVMTFGKNPQHDFPKMRGGQRPLGTFPKNSSVLGGQASLRAPVGANKKGECLRHNQVRLSGQRTPEMHNPNPENVILILNIKLCNLYCLYVLQGILGPQG